MERKGAVVKVPKTPNSRLSPLFQWLGIRLCSILEEVEPTPSNKRRNCMANSLLDSGVGCMSGTYGIILQSGHVPKASSRTGGLSLLIPH